MWVYLIANFLYPGIMNRVYKGYVENNTATMGIGQRPVRIMVDYPALAKMISGDVLHSGTEVVVVDEATTTFF